MTPILPCGGCSACERCEALRWACRLSSDAERRAAREWCRSRPALTEAKAWALDTLLDPAHAAELLRVLLEARGVQVYPMAEEDPGDVVRFPCVSLGLDGNAIAIEVWRRAGGFAHASITLDSPAALILALLGIKPAEQREAAMRAVEAAR